MLEVLHGSLTLRSFRLGGAAPRTFEGGKTVGAGETLAIRTGDGHRAGGR